MRIGQAAATDHCREVSPVYEGASHRSTAGYRRFESVPQLAFDSVQDLVQR